MDRVRAGFLGHADDLGDGEIGRDRAQPLADPVGLVRLEPVQAQLVFLGIDGHRLLAQLVRRAHHANGDFAPVRDKNLPNHQVISSLFLLLPRSFQPRNACSRPATAP
jgi:hypothetical protein